MPLKQGETVTFKMNKIDLITLDSNAQSKGMNRSEYIKYCITQEVERSKNDIESKARLNDFQRLMESLIAINATASKSLDTAVNSRQTILKGIVQIQKSILAAFPENQEIEKILYGGEK